VSKPGTHPLTAIDSNMLPVGRPTCHR